MWSPRKTTLEIIREQNFAMFLELYNHRTQRQRFFRWNWTMIRDADRTSPDESLATGAWEWRELLEIADLDHFAGKALLDLVYEGKTNAKKRLLANNIAWQFLDWRMPIEDISPWVLAMCNGEWVP